MGLWLVPGGVMIRSWCSPGEVLVSSWGGSSVSGVLNMVTPFVSVFLRHLQYVTTSGHLVYLHCLDKNHQCPGESVQEPQNSLDSQQ